MEEKEKPSVVKQQPVKREGREKPDFAAERQEDDYIQIQRADLKPVWYNEFDLNELIFTVVKALQNVSRVRFYGVRMLMDILMGTNTKRVLDNNLHKIPEFGALKELHYDTVQSIIEWMISEHLILKTKERYPVLHSTYEGLHYPR